MIMVNLLNLTIDGPTNNHIKKKKNHKPVAYKSHKDSICQMETYKPTLLNRSLTPSRETHIFPFIYPVKNHIHTIL